MKHLLKSSLWKLKPDIQSVIIQTRVMCHAIRTTLKFIFFLENIQLRMKMLIPILNHFITSPSILLLPQSWSELLKRLHFTHKIIHKAWHLLFDPEELVVAYSELKCIITIVRKRSAKGLNLKEHHHLPKDLKKLQEIVRQILYLQTMLRVLIDIVIQMELGIDLKIRICNASVLGDTNL